MKLGEIFVKTNSSNSSQTSKQFSSIDVIFDGTGYVTEFSVEKDTEITEDMILNVTLNPKFVDEVKLEEKKLCLHYRRSSEILWVQCQIPIVKQGFPGGAIGHEPVCQWVVRCGEMWV